MVDFSSDGMVGKPPKEIVSLIIIEKLYNFLEADEAYSKTLFQGTESFISIPRSRLRNLFLCSYPLLKRGLKKEEEFNALWSICMDAEHDVKEEDLLNAFICIVTHLDKIGLLKLDTKPVFNRMNIEQSNKAQGYG